MKCPECSAEIGVAEENEGTIICKVCLAELDASVLIDISKNDEETTEHEPEEEAVVVPFCSKLPAKFLAVDPDFLDQRLASWRSERVLLPKRSGGVTSVDRNVVRIQHGGKTIELKKLSAEEKRIWQFWINLLAISLGILLFVLFFWLIY